MTKNAITKKPTYSKKKVLEGLKVGINEMQLINKSKLQVISAKALLVQLSAISEDKARKV